MKHIIQIVNIILILCVIYAICGFLWGTLLIITYWVLKRECKKREHLEEERKIMEQKRLEEEQEKKRKQEEEQKRIEEKKRKQDYEEYLKKRKQEEEQKRIEEKKRKQDYEEYLKKRKEQEQEAEKRKIEREKQAAIEAEKRRKARELETARLIAEENEFNDNLPVYVYLMRNYNNGHYKIGIAKDTKYREKTLQAEEPDVRLICSKQYTDRITARQMEKMLHSHYDKKRLRGEWFDFNEDEVKSIQKLLK